VNSSEDDQKKLLTLHGWSVLAHPMFLDQMTRLALAAAEEMRDSKRSTPGPNTKLLAHLKDLAFDAIPRDPANKAFRQGKTLGPNRKHWFRGKTGNGRYRLFFRFHSPSRVIVLAWVNDSQSLRSYGSATDAYAVFGYMLDEGNPPDSWNDLVRAARDGGAIEGIRRMSAAGGAEG
jgi:toxin YhaV